MTTRISSSVIANNAITSASIANNSISPAQLTTGAPTWTANNNLYVSSNLSVSGTLTVSGNIAFQNTTINNVTINTTDQIVVTNTTPSISNTTGALIVSGGVGVLGNLYSSSTYTNGLTVNSSLTLNNGGVAQVVLQNSDNTNYYAIGNNGATGGTNGNLVFYQGGGGATRMILDTSGNFGLGVTPSAWSTTTAVTALQLPNGSLMTYSNAYGFSNLYLSANAYLNSSGNWIFTKTNSASLYQQTDRQHAWLYSNSGTAGSTVTFTQAMTLDASGSFMVGTTTNYSIRAVIAGAGQASSTGTGSYLVASLADTNTMAQGCGGGLGFQGNDGVNGLVTFASVNGSKENATSGNYASYLSFSTRANGAGLTEKARIDSSGNLLVGTTSSSINNVGVQLNGSINNSTQYCRAFYNAVYGDTYALPQFVGNQAGTYFWGLGNDSGTANANTLRLGTVSGNSTGWFFAGGYFNLKGGAYTNASDYRLKRDVKTFSDSVLERIKIARPISYKQIVQDEKGGLVDCRTEIGFLAHELQELFPEFVLGEKDAVDAAGNIDAQGVDYAKFTAVLTKAIQEQQAMITTLQTQVTSLQATVETQATTIATLQNKIGA